MKITLGRKQAASDVRVAIERDNVRPNVGHQQANVVEINASVHAIRGPKRFEEIAVTNPSRVKNVPRRLVRIAPAPFCDCPIRIRIGQHLEPRSRTIELHGARQPTEMIAHVTWANRDCDDHEAGAVEPSLNLGNPIGTARQLAFWILARSKNM